MLAGLMDLDGLNDHAFELATLLESLHRLGMLSFLLIGLFLCNLFASSIYHAMKEICLRHTTVPLLP